MGVSKRVLAERAAERDEARAAMREYLHPGDRVCPIMRHVSQSGMLRCISLVVAGETNTWRGKVPAPIDITYDAARAMGEKIHQRHGGIAVGGCGMDMGYHLVYGLSRALWPDGFPCIGEHCPSNDHSNGQPRSLPGAVHHRDGGYALRHDWL